MVNWNCELHSPYRVPLYKTDRNNTLHNLLPGIFFCNSSLFRINCRSFLVKYLAIASLIECIFICSNSQHFREQRVTGRILALLTTDHFVKAMGMKLGPAVLLSEAVAKKVQDSTKMYSCDACRSIALSQPMHPMALPLWVLHRPHRLHSWTSWLSWKTRRSFDLGDTGQSNHLHDL